MCFKQKSPSHTHKTSTFPSCSQIRVVFYHCVMHGLGFFYLLNSLLITSVEFLGIVEPVSTGQTANDYLTRTVTPTLLKGLTELCKMKPADPIVSWQCNLYDMNYLLLQNEAFFFPCQFSFFL